MNKCPKLFGLLLWFGDLFPNYDASDTNSLSCSYIKLLPALLCQNVNKVLVSLSKGYLIYVLWSASPLASMSLLSAAALQ